MAAASGAGGRQAGYSRERAFHDPNDLAFCIGSRCFRGLLSRVKRYKCDEFQ